MIGLDPVKVDTAGSQIRKVLNILDDITSNVRTALLRSEMTSSHPDRLDDIDFEFTLLDEIIRQRAVLACEYQLDLSNPSRTPTDRLWDQLLDPDNATDPLRGDDAVTILLENLLLADQDGNEIIDHAELERFSKEGSNLGTRHAALYLLNFPELVEELSWGRRGFAAEDLEDFLTENAEIREFATEAQERLKSGGDFPSFKFSTGTIMNADRLLTAAINRHTYANDPESARSFILNMPNAAHYETTISTQKVHDAALAVLHDTAKNGVLENDLRMRGLLLEYLPESNGGYRNLEMARFYARLGLEIDRLINAGIIDRNDPMFSGASWLLFGAGAVFSVGTTIRGEDKGYNVTVMEVMQQSFADGNQRIFSNVVPYFVDFLAIFADGEVTEERVIKMLGQFGDGQRELRLAFAALIGVLVSDDPAERAELQFVSNICVGLHEQTIIDDLLDLDQIGFVNKLGGRIVSAFAATMNPEPGTVSGINVFGPFQSRSAGQIATDDGTLTNPIGHNDNGQAEGPSIPIGGDIPESTYTNSALDGFEVLAKYNPASLDLDSLGLPFDLSSLPDIESVVHGTGLSDDAKDWLAADPDLEVDDWTAHADRMKYIAVYFWLYQNHPVMFESAEFLASQTPNPFPPVP